jgi:Zn-finger nucleic acid-binding protein
MNCPNCGFELRHQTFKGVDIDRCSECAGIWLSAPDLESFEDRDFQEAEIEGATLHEREESKLLCPDCRHRMHVFNYKYYDLRLEFCPKHGYWIDPAEEKRVMQFMDKEAKALMNNISAETRWANILIKLRSPAFWGRLNLL